MTSGWYLNGRGGVTEKRKKDVNRKERRQCGEVWQGEHAFKGREGFG